MADRPAGPRAVALVGPYLSGKTTLLEALLFASGTTNRRGTARDGNTVGDHSTEARARQMSTELNVAAAKFLDDPWTILDCPGSVELAWEAQNALLAADVAVVVCEPETERVLTLSPLFKFLDDHAIPHMVFINKMDIANARVSEVLAALQGVSQRPLVMRQVPLPDPEGKAIGYVDLVSERAYKYKPGQASDLIKLPEDVLEEERVTRAGLVEKLADFDDKLLEQLLEDVQPSKDEIYRHLTQNLTGDRIVPVFLGSAQLDHGVRRLWKALRHETPAVASTAARFGLSRRQGRGGAGDQDLSRAAFRQAVAGRACGAAGDRRHEPQRRPRRRRAAPHRRAPGEARPWRRPGEVVALARMEGIATGTVLATGTPPAAAEAAAAEAGLRPGARRREARR